MRRNFASDTHQPEMSIDAYSQKQRMAFSEFYLQY